MAEFCWSAWLDSKRFKCLNRNAQAYFEPTHVINKTHCNLCFLFNLRFGCGRLRKLANEVVQTKAPIQAPAAYCARQRPCNSFASRSSSSRSYIFLHKAARLPCCHTTEDFLIRGHDRFNIVLTCKCDKATLSQSLPRATLGD